MGLNSVIEEGLGTFGTRVIMVELTSLRRALDWKKDWIALHTSLPTIGQDFLKKQAVKPSGPGALSLPREKIVLLTSSTVTTCSKSTLVASEKENFMRFETVVIITPSFAALDDLSRFW
jgi:hypothetical protein